MIFHAYVECILFDAVGRMCLSVLSIFFCVLCVFCVPEIRCVCLSIAHSVMRWRSAKDHGRCRLHVTADVMILDCHVFLVVVPSRRGRFCSGPYGISRRMVLRFARRTRVCCAWFVRWYFAYFCLDLLICLFVLSFSRTRLVSCASWRSCFFFFCGFPFCMLRSSWSCCLFTYRFSWKILLLWCCRLWSGFFCGISWVASVSS